MTDARSSSVALDAETLLAQRPWLARFSRALVADPADVDDVVQQTFANALARPPAHASNLRGWLGTIARNVVRSRSRSDLARGAREVALPPPPPVEDPSEAVERAELRRVVVEEVLALAEPYRTTVILRFLEERQVEAIARVMRTNEDTVRTRIRRGVARVRKGLERRTEERARKAAQDPAGARALLFTGLRAIAAGGAGELAPHAASRPLGRALGSSARVATRRMLVGAAAVAVLGGATWWWDSTRSREPQATDVATSRSPDARTPGENAAPPSVAAAERAEERAPPPSTPTTPPAAPQRPEARGSIRGLVTDVHGNPVVGADVWAISSTNYEPVYAMDAFTPMAQEQAGHDPRLHSAGDWIGTKTGTGGRFQFDGLSTVPGWSLGAFEAKTGARITEPRCFERGRSEMDVNVELMPGNVVRGVVRDREGNPIGNARVFLHVTYGGRTTRSTIIAEPSGPHAGEFSAGFRCGDSREIECFMPGFLSIPKKRVDVAQPDVAPRVDEMELTVVMDRAPGRLVRGRIVDPTGLPVALEPILERHFAIQGAARRTLKTSVWAITAGVQPPPLLAGTPTDSTIVEGRIDFVANMYEIVVPEDFRGSVQLQISKYVVGTAPLGDLARAPDVACDERVLPASTTVRNVAVRYVDAESKQPIDLTGEQLPPTAMDPTGTFVPLVKEESDPEHGVIVYRCASTSLRFEPFIAGYAFAQRFVDLPAVPAAEPLILEVPPAARIVRGVARHADGRPLARAALSVYRSTPEGIADATTQPTVTSDEGEFEFSGLAKGEHFVVVSAEPEEAPVVARFVASDRVTEVELRTSVGVTTAFKLVTKPENGTWDLPYFRISDASDLTLFCPRYDWPKLTRSSDSIVLSLLPGHYTVTAQPPHFRESKLEFDVPAPGVVEIPVEPNEAPKK
jgi:RNA polymerase sigma-70 factor (ECF subfamily)